MSANLRLAFLGSAIVVLGSLQSAPATPIPTFLVNPGVYTATASSSGVVVPVDNLFDADNNTYWAIQGYVGLNPQGRDEAWVSVELNKAYQISQIGFAPRKSTGATDGIDEVNIWISTTPFGVDPQDGVTTSSFLATPTGMSPDITIGPFPDFLDHAYALSSATPGKYLLAQLINTSDIDNNRNLGARTLRVGVVPEPGTFALAAFGMLGLVGFGWRSRRKRAA